MLSTETQQLARVLADKLAELTNQRQDRQNRHRDQPSTKARSASSPQRETLP